MTRFWTDDRMGELRQRAGDGESARVIAGAMGTTRNAVIGKCYRERIVLQEPAQPQYVAWGRQGPPARGRGAMIL